MLWCALFRVSSSLMDSDSWEILRPSLSPCCLGALKSMGFDTMTPVQSATIPYLLQCKDVAVQAVTGSGKTLAFVVPTMEMLLRREGKWSTKETGTVVVTPTRELASQIAGVFAAFLPPSLSLALLIGGQDIATDVQRINTKGAQIVVATPGRLVDLLTRSDCSLAITVKALEVLVLDEADRLLEMGFRESITTILSYLPKQRRTGLFSATLNDDVKALMVTGLRNPVTITVTDKDRLQDTSRDPTPTSLHTHYLVCSADEKFPQLLAILQQLRDQKTMVFLATCASVSYFAQLTRRLAPSLHVLSLHGHMHSKRQKLFEEFSALESGVVMCTDVLARGVDFPSVDWVIHFDPPSSTKVFVHRCGRTARMGREGQALVMLLDSEASYVDFLRLNQHILLHKFIPSLPPTPSVLSEAQELAAREREIYEQGIRAYVSFVHFYYKHECKLIFRPKDLDLITLARGFALLHLPKMPELRGRDSSSFIPHPTPPSSIPYKDRTREKQRLAKMQREKEDEKRPKERTSAKRKQSKSVNTSKSSKKHSRKRKREQLSEGELDELAREARLLKKFKAGKISKAELEAELDGDSS